ncbi:MAG: hypothetical protein AAF982_10925, partial [Pseudomonadota bacterium]
MRAGKTRDRCCVDENGVKRPFHLCCPVCREEMAEAARARLIARSRPPAGCGPEIVPAPARGPVETFTPVVMIPEGERGWRSVELGYRDRAAARAQDAFDRMMHQAM